MTPFDRAVDAGIKAENDRYLRWAKANPERAAADIDRDARLAWAASGWCVECGDPGHQVHPKPLPPMASEVAVPADLGPARIDVGTMTVGRTAYTVSAWQTRRSDAEKPQTFLMLTGVRGAQYGLMPHAVQRTDGVTTLALVNVGPGRSWSTPRWAQGLLFVLTDNGRFGYVR